MLAYAIRRLGLSLLILIVVMTAMYTMVFLVPGDPASLALGPRAPDVCADQRQCQPKPPHFRFPYPSKPPI